MTIRTAALALLAALLLAGPGSAAAADWTRFVHAPSGAAVDVPPGFAVDAAHEAPGTGRLFRSAEGRALLRVAGQPITQGQFSAFIENAIARDQDDGWSVTFRSETPDWAAWTASRGGTILHVRVILVCDDRQTATLRFTYPALDIGRYEPMAERAGRSLGQDGGCY